MHSTIADYVDVGVVTISLFVFFIFVMVCYSLVFISKLLKPNKSKTINDGYDYYIVSAPRSSLWAMVIFIFIIGSLSSIILLLIPISGTLSLLLWLIFVILVGFAIYLIYGFIYYMSYETKVEGNKLKHKELFYPEFTFTFKDIKGARYGRRVGNLMLVISNNQEVLLEAEDHFTNFDLLVSNIENKASVRIEDKDLAINFHRITK